MAFEKNTARNGQKKARSVANKKMVFSSKRIAKKQPKALKKVGKKKSSAKSSTTSSTNGGEKSAPKKSLIQFEQS